MEKETGRCDWVLIVSKHFNVAVDDIDTKKSAGFYPGPHCKRDPV